MLPEDVQAVMAKVLFMTFAMLILFSAKVKAQDYQVKTLELVEAYRDL